jgi:glutamyl-Q tRNA(Asp) synthetase
LHLGTLTAAVASYLHARQANGSWLIRIEDIDPPREIAGSADSILKALTALELEWDGEVLYQSTRLRSYLECAADLVAAGQAYYCRCSRRDIRAKTGSAIYPGTCRSRSLPPGDAAIRLRTGSDPVRFVDGVQGAVERDIENSDGDFVLIRRDGLPAYHLAAVLDDADQKITDVVRGADLLASTPLHIYLQRCLGLPTPNYWHVPVIRDAAGEKLSKRAGARPIDLSQPAVAAAQALEYLGLRLPEDMRGAQPAALWQWAKPRWKIRDLTGKS